ncbi:TlpA family protein disulfide reductase [Gordonia zhaorongruii]|uniref:TlpA family protein disulfide reductase n=1 Tax=Gordonia zhaorongruii TaxID=2597659 RepID=UPI001F40AAF5|nr:TlpA disulfide reductase family protein [Gordonia zhaorongruii]
MSGFARARSVLAQPGMRAMIAFVVVMVALVAALWPRGDSTDDAVSGPPGSTPTSGVTDGGVSQQQMSEARAAAALEPCPAGDGASAGVLAGVNAPCMADGRRIDVGAATAGRPLVINMWAVWCLPCRRELPLFDHLSSVANDRLNVLAVHAREGAEKQYFVLKFLQEVGVHMPVVTDPNGAVAKAIGAPRIFPSTVMITADGRVAAVLPRVFEDFNDLSGAVREHLGVDLGAA